MKTPSIEDTRGTPRPARSVCRNPMADVLPEVEHGVGAEPGCRAPSLSTALEVLTSPQGEGKEETGRLEREKESSLHWQRTGLPFRKA